MNWRSAMTYDAMIAINAGGKSCVHEAEIGVANCLTKQFRSPGFGLVGSGQSLRFNGKGDRDMEAIIVKVSGQGVNRSFQLQNSSLPIAAKSGAK